MFIRIKNLANAAHIWLDCKHLVVDDYVPNLEKKRMMIEIERERKESSLVSRPNICIINYVSNKIERTHCPRLH